MLLTTARCLLGAVLVGTALLLYGGCAGAPVLQPNTTPTPVGIVQTGSRVNITQAARLAQTVRIEIAQFAPEAGATPPYLPIVTITEQTAIAQFVQALDQEVEVGMQPACIAAYEVRFYRADGVVGTFGYTCSDDQAYFTRGAMSDRSFGLGGEVRLPERFQELVDLHQRKFTS